VARSTPARCSPARSNTESTSPVGSTMVVEVESSISRSYRESPCPSGVVCVRAEPLVQRAPDTPIHLFKDAEAGKAGLPPSKRLAEASKNHDPRGTGRMPEGSFVDAVSAEAKEGADNQLLPWLEAYRSQNRTDCPNSQTAKQVPAVSNYRPARIDQPMSSSSSVSSKGRPEPRCDRLSTWLGPV
jgi:hypothetical protein